MKGITPELFYGTYVPVGEDAPADAPRLIGRPGLVDCFTVFGPHDQVDANTASPAVLAAIGLSPDAVSALVQRRQLSPLDQQQLSSFIASAGNGAARLRLGGNSIVTVRATARLRIVNGQLSDLRRTVGALIKYMPDGSDAPIHTLRWYDTVWSY